ncbi:hypothetical protein JNB_09799 [Janibacter sp. HTCC2649]|uniref:alpha-L-fucosidase n=1 Tax=Janibacter sp. HTCC2649 TaxID=313589 RepID=UPI000067096D|nr:alpha-L-fucosidase [Janibacter sp. HTCC2649]EAQ00457.1 hypothetical protein JNB_09799 [Janibacter sp. HTCC2649]
MAEPGPDLTHLAHVVPSARQLAWQELEFYGFLHFGMNTMTDREWGDGTESPALFAPETVDADDWVALCAEAGMSAVILTCKHHDGFALWPTRHSDHSVRSSPWRSGSGDLVREVAQACARAGLKFGIYLSPWDRAEKTYGEGTAYDDFYVAQLTELLTGYGPIFCVWLDGANGEGPSGRRQEYDWDRYHRVVRALQPEAVISVCGPDVRWCGNEAGHTRPDEWSVVPWELRSAELTASLSQQADDGAFSRAVRSADEDLGSREALEGYPGEPVWYPAEVNTSIRPGWFHHDHEDAEVRSAHELFEIYRRSVGGNATLLLNVPPRRDGTIAAEDAVALRGLGALIREWEASDIAGEAETTFSANSVGPCVTLRWPAEREVRAVVLKEDIRLGQRIEGVEIHRVDGDERVLLATAGSVGYQRFIEFPPTRAQQIEVTITSSRATPMLAGVGVVQAGQFGPDATSGERRGIGG